MALSEERRRTVIVMTMGFLGGLVMLDETILGVALPTIRDALKVSQTHAHWILNAYLLAFTCLAAVGGKCMDLFGLRRSMIAAGSLFVIASLIAGFSDILGVLIAMRAIQGGCAAIIFPLTLAGATTAFPKEQRGKAIGILAGTATIFLAAGPLVGGILTDFVSWRWVFWINIPIVVGGVAIVCAIWEDQPRKEVRPQIDKIGLVLVLAGLTALVFALMEGQDYGWTSPVILGTLVVGLVGLVAFNAYELRQKAPLVDMALFKIPVFNASALIILATQYSKIVVAVFVPFFLQDEMNFSPVYAGLGMVIAVLPFPILSTTSGNAADKYGSRLPVLIGLAVTAAATGILGGLMLMKSYLVLAPVLLAWGLALPFAMIPGGRIAMNAVPMEKQGEVSGMVITIRLIGGTLGVTIGSLILSLGLGFPMIFIVSGVLLIAVLGYCFWVLEEEYPAKKPA
ncbi:EmrB/QacA subfamily drug resistance transporter [Roseibium hamelinense]|uniref:EmrB/QacA subfamily drug resistance transporter n=1 Tax=Roseibium hamelinense TaxID=150831 RepID=A0A562SVG8_9HYPH|nr:MFS transporter [Roseibium hamelinense]MTI43165.1 MFS transporter [Roseibium hamelinense]TWI84786.1 EmrB/QacA subfamily drug resistance transporter [Roseibium hamelinense]